MARNVTSTEVLDWMRTLIERSSALDTGPDRAGAGRRTDIGVQPPGGLLLRDGRSDESAVRSRPADEVPRIPGHGQPPA